MKLKTTSSGFYAFLATCFLLITITVSGCGNVAREQHNSQVVQPPFTSFYNIPGITAEEIAAIETLQKNRKAFIFGNLYSIEAFFKENGSGGGYTSLMCAWLSDLFGIPFQLVIYPSDELNEKILAYEVDFGGNMGVNAERLLTFKMTDTIAERQYQVFRLRGSQSLDQIAQDRLPKYAFVQTQAAWRAVAAVTEPDSYETVWINNYAEAYPALVSGKADAFIGPINAEANFITFEDMYSDNFYPLIFSPVSMYTANSDLQPVITVMTKALRNGAMPYLTYLYEVGYREYMRYKMSTQLSNEEHEYIASHPIVPVVANYDNYPVCFYNTREGEWQGIFFDLLDEITAVTGLSFNLINENNADWPVIYEMVRSGEASLIADLVRNHEREAYFIWPETGLQPDYFALISKSDYRDITINEIQNARVGVAQSTIYASTFKQWFPNHTKTVEYENMDRAINALQRNEVDLVMSTQRRLMLLTHFLELSGYKTNIVFDQPIQTISGVNKNEEFLCSIIDKALKIIDTTGISDRWMRRTYDYRAKLVEARIPLLIGASALTLAVLALMILMFWRQRNEGKRLETLVAERTGDLHRQNTLMSTVNAATAVLLKPDTDSGFDAVNHSMEMVGQSVGVDRVFLWQNFNKADGKLYYKQVYKWTQAKYAMADDMHKYSYEEAMPVWKDLLFEGKSINGPLDTLPGYDPNSFSAYNIQSILAVPLFFNNEMWGFVSFDDCRNRRFFPEADEYTLRSWGLLVVGAIQRGEIMSDLRDAVDEAKKASEAKSRFIANMNHEMRTPMNVIVGLTDLMLEETDTHGKTKETLEKISTAGNTLMRLISDVLDISKAEAGSMDLSPEQYDVANVLNDIIAFNVIRIGDKLLTFELDINRSLPSILFGDYQRVKQILNNLMSNAFKYTREGTVKLGVDCQLEGKNQGDDVWLLFSVSDTGIGIREEDINKLFTAYNQVDTRASRNIEGSGLGLSITKKLVEMMDGEITVESQYGKGTTFRVRIRQGFITDQPLDSESVDSLRDFHYLNKKKHTHEKHKRLDLSYARVLVVDDFPTNLDVATGMLRKYRMQVDCVMSGQDAVNCITIGVPVYNAIFMDHMMPGMDGIEATKLIRAIGTEYAVHIPIIALTANAVAGNEQMFLDNGFNAFLAKPINVTNLDTVVQQWVKDKSNEK